MEADASNVYVSSSGHIDAVPIGGGPWTDLLQGYTALGVPRPIAIDSTNVYFADWNAGLSRLASVPKQGGSVTVLTTVSDQIENVATDGTNLYARGANYVFSIPVGGGTVTTLAASDGYVDSVPALATDGSNVYWSVAKPSAGIMSVPVGGGTATSIYAGAARWIRASGGYVYFFVSGALARTKSSWNGAAQNIFVGSTPYAVGDTAAYVTHVGIASVDLTNFIATPFVNTPPTSGAQMAWSYSGTWHYVFWGGTDGDLKEVRFP